MLFNTLAFAKFFALAWLGTWLLAALSVPRLAALLRAQVETTGRAKHVVRVLFLLGMSYGFYAGWNWRYLPLILASSTVDFYLGRVIGRTADARRRKLLLAVTVVLNLGFLSYFKYTNFLLDNVRALADLFGGGAQLDVFDIVRTTLPPVGISFFTFESMSYVIDVYRGDLEAHDSYLEYLLFVAFFPHLVAGPIVRPRDLLPQLARNPVLGDEDGGSALFLVAIGLLKKVAIADPLAVNLVDRVFDRPDSYSSLETLAGVYGYAIQIYFDFSGYTDIATGCALLLGVRFPRNFDEPYKAASLASFWRKWHISLSTWLRDYLYVPLGGNRGSSLSTYRNLMLTMLLGGLWHGSSWTFVFWGFLHGLGLAASRWWERRGPKDAPAPGPLRAALGALFTFHWVCLAWVFFRAPSFSVATHVLRRLGSLTTWHPNLGPYVLALLCAGFAGALLPTRWFEGLRKGFVRLPGVGQGVTLFVVAWILHEVASADEVPFVYFQF